MIFIKNILAFSPLITILFPLNKNHMNFICSPYCFIKHTISDWSPVLASDISSTLCVPSLAFSFRLHHPEMTRAGFSKFSLSAYLVA